MLGDILLRNIMRIIVSNAHATIMCLIKNKGSVIMGSILTHTFGTYTVFRTIHSIYENTNEVAPCIVAFTPCDDMMLSTSTMGYELQDVFDTFDYLMIVYIFLFQMIIFKITLLLRILRTICLNMKSVPLIILMT